MLNFMIRKKPGMKLIYETIEEKEMKIVKRTDEYNYLFEEECLNKNLILNEFAYLKTSHFISIFKSNIWYFWEKR